MKDQGSNILLLLQFYQQISQHKCVSENDYLWLWFWLAWLSFSNNNKNNISCCCLWGVGLCWYAESFDLVFGLCWLSRTGTPRARAFVWLVDASVLYGRKRWVDNKIRLPLFLLEFLNSFSRSSFVMLFFREKKKKSNCFTCFWCLYHFCHHCEPQPLYNSTSPDPVRPLWHLMDVQWWPMWSNDRKNWWRSRQIAQTTTMTRRRPKKLWHYLKLKWVVVHQLIRDIIDAQPSFFMDGPSSLGFPIIRYGNILWDDQAPNDFQKVLFLIWSQFS